MYHVIDQFLKELPSQFPLACKAVYPRRIIPPNGYLNPKYFAATLYTELESSFTLGMTLLPHIIGTVNCFLQMEYRVPTYFIRSEFAQAVSQTEPPQDFKFSEIKWPLPAMLFVLPTEFVLRYFGYMCPFISITHSEAGTYPDRCKLPPLDSKFKHFEPVQSEVERFNVVYPVYSSKELPVDYSGTYPLKMLVHEIAHAPYHDATNLEEKLMPYVFEKYELNTPTPDLPNGEAETKFNARVQSFAVKLMLALTARPNTVQTGTRLRRERIFNSGHVRDELWNPNLVGWDYRARRLPAAAGELGTHASPRMHWRKGHYRNQPHGPKPWGESTPKELIWIEPVLVNAAQETTQNETAK